MFNYSSKKGCEAKLAIQSTKLNFSPFYSNAQCLVRQEFWLLNENSNWWFFFCLNLSQGFINKSSYKSQDTHYSIQISYLTDPYVSVLVINNSNKWSLSNPSDELKDSDFWWHVVFKMLNQPMTYKQQLRCNYAQSTS
jgi:hypothetical protein